MHGGAASTILCVTKTTGWSFRSLFIGAIERDADVPSLDGAERSVPTIAGHSSCAMARQFSSILLCLIERSKRPL